MSRNQRAASWLRAPSCALVLGVVFASALGLPATAVEGTDAASAPYPPSPVISGITYDWSLLVRAASGSDNWPVTWADDDHQYAVWGDGNGWTPGDSRVSLGVARIEGPAGGYTGRDVWGGTEAENPAQFEGKSYGILAVGARLYMWVSPSSGAASFDEARLASSNDHGATWTLAGWAFTEADGVVIPTFLNFGRAYAGARDAHVYAYFIGLQDASRLGIQMPGEIFLGRVPTAQVTNRQAWQFYAGSSGGGSPIWSADLQARVPVFRDAAGVGWSLSASHNAGLGRYVLCTEHERSGQGSLGIFDAPEPWGPWSTVSYVSNWEGRGHTFYWSFPNKWLSVDGRSFTMVYSGWQTEDAWHSVRGTFVGATTSLDDGDVALHPFVFASPNPSRADLVVHYDVGSGGLVRVRIFDASGRTVRNLFDGVSASGRGRLPWDGRDERAVRVPAGVYFLEAAGGGAPRVTRITVLP